MRAEFDRRLLAGPSAARPELVLVIGELVDLAPYVGLLGQVGERGASCGIRLLAASTRPGSELAAHPLLPDFGTRLIQRTADEDESMALLGTADAAYLGGGGRLLFRSEQRTPVDLYAYHVAPPDLERLVEVMTARYGASPGRRGAAGNTSSTMPEGNGLERGPEPGSGPESDEPAAEPDGMEAPADRAMVRRRGPPLVARKESRPPAT